MRESTFRFDIKEKTLVIMAFVFIFLSLFIPLWQIGVNHSLELKIRNDEMALRELDAEERRVRISLAESEAEWENRVVLSSVNEMSLRLSQLD